MLAGEGGLIDELVQVGHRRYGSSRLIGLRRAVRVGGTMQGSVTKRPSQGRHLLPLSSNARRMHYGLIDIALMSCRDAPTAQ